MTESSPFKRYSALLSKLLAARGISTDEEADLFLNPHYERDLHDPMLLGGMKEAVERIVRALETGERIKIVADFDADGIPSAVIMNDVFAKIGMKDFSISIPHRNTEGFGLNERLVDECIANNVTLLITLDCGMGDALRIDRARAANIDVIIIDHHQPGADGVPNAIIVNPNAPDDDYPNKNLCGAGVCYKVVKAFLKKIQDTRNNERLSFAKASEDRQEESLKLKDESEDAESPKARSQKLEAVPLGWEKWLLDMVGIATLSDMVKLVGENRALAHYGLMVLRKSRRPGIRALCERARIRQSTLTDDDVVFTITPRINAASRMDEPEAAFRLLSATTQTEADELAEHLDSVNNARKGAVAAMSKEIHAMLADRELPSVIVVGNTHWRPGLLGLAASKVAETYQRPAFVWGQGEAAMIKGSCRSGGTLDVMLLMTEAREHFVEFGGHTQSGGFSTTVQHIVSLEETLSLAAERVEKKAGSVVPDYDAELAHGDITETTLRDIEQLAPFGTGNKKPIFFIRDAFITSAESFGKEKQHTRLLISATPDDLATVSAIQFFSQQTLKDITAGETLSFLVTLERDAFVRGMPVRLRIVEVVK